MNFKILLFGLVLTSIFCIATTALAMTDTEKQALIAQIQQQLSQLTQQLAQLQGTNSTTASTSTNWCHTFNTNLGTNDFGNAEISYLHTALQREGISYSPDDVNTYATGTMQAVVQLQAKYNITPQSGYTGVKTRTQLNQLYACSSQNTNTNNTNCTVQWQCGDWGSCINGQQGRSCYDLNYCGVLTNAPTQLQSCISTTTTTPTTPTTYTPPTRTYTPVTTTTPTTTTTTPCTSEWKCDDWGPCINGHQSKSCSLANGCYTLTNIPIQSQSCTATPTTTTTTTTPPTTTTTPPTITGSSTPGCTSASGYSTTTGAPCVALASGCTSGTGFSATTGKSCYTVVEGCTSASGNSKINGMPCDGSVPPAGFDPWDIMYPNYNKCRKACPLGLCSDGHSPCYDQKCVIDCGNKYGSS